MQRDRIASRFRRSAVVEMKRRAFHANFEAKRSEGSRREMLYRIKNSAINFLLETGYAYVDSVDWSVPDPTFSVEFVGGGRLHTKLSGLSSAALRSVRRQLNGNLQPPCPAFRPDGWYGVAEAEGARN